MSVPKSKRTLSKYEFYNKAYDIHKQISSLLIRDFGIKSISRELKTFVHSAKMNPTDRENFKSLCEKYHIDVESEYPLWQIDYYRNWILKSLSSLINNITKAYSIFPKEPFFEFESKLRRYHQQLAISDCEQIIQALQLAGEVLPVDFEKFMPYVDLVLKEIDLIKSWRKSSTKLYINNKNNNEDKLANTVIETILENNNSSVFKD